jgi:hypothetical protein
MRQWHEAVGITSQRGLKATTAVAMPNILNPSIYEQISSAKILEKTSGEVLQDCKDVAKNVIVAI